MARGATTQSPRNQPVSPTGTLPGFGPPTELYYGKRIRSGFLGANLQNPKAKLFMQVKKGVDGGGG